MVQRCFIQKHWSKMPLLENTAGTEIRTYITQSIKMHALIVSVKAERRKKEKTTTPEKLMAYMIVGFRLSCRRFSLASIAQALFSLQVESSSDHSNMFY